MGKQESIPVFNSTTMHDAKPDCPCTEHESSGCQVDDQDSMSTLQRGQQLWFSEVAREHEEVFVNEFRSVTGKFDLIEVCAPWDSPLCEHVMKQGGRAMRLGCHNGYDLSTKAGLIRAMQTLRKHRPRYLHFSPPCDPWTIMNNANRRTQDQVDRILEKQKHGRRILKNCRKLAELQVRELGGDAGGEQPLRASSWKETSWKHIVSLCQTQRFRCDGCMFDLRSPKTGNLLLKSWGWFSSRKDIVDKLQKKCCHGTCAHEPIEGDITSSTAVYPPDLCKAFARVLRQSRSQVHAIFKQLAQIQVYVNDDDGVDEQNIVGDDHVSDEPIIFDNLGEEEQPEQEHDHDRPADPEGDNPEQPAVDQDPAGDESGNWGPETIKRKLRTIHANLGHPSNAVLCRLLKEAQARHEILEAARNFECSFCRQRGHAAPHRTSAVTRSSDKWDVVSVDSFWWYSPHRDAKGNPVIQAVGLSFLGETTDFHVGVVVRTGGKNLPNVNAKEFRKHFQNEWLKHYPNPKVLRMDDEGCFRDVANLEWFDSMNIKPELVAGEAAWQVGKQSRHAATMKEIMTKLSLEHGPDMSPEELMALALNAKNRLHQVKGYTPNQWAFGVEKESLESWLQVGDHKPTQSLRSESLSFEENLQRIQKAKEAFLQVDARRRLLRAAKGKERKAVIFQVGDFVYFYRKGRNATSNRHAGWYGPARVIGVEKHGTVEENQTQGSIVWITHGNTLYRCAPEQLRHVTHGLQDVARDMHTDNVFEEV